MGDSSSQRPGLTSLRGLGVLPRRQSAAMGIVTQWAIRLQTSDFYGPSPPTPNPPSPP